MKIIENYRKALAAGISIKGLKSSKGHDGPIWSCSVYLSGVKLGDIREDGWGGGLIIEISPSSQSELVSALKKVEYPLDELSFKDLGEYGPTTDAGYIEWVLPKIVDELEAIKKMRRAVKTKTLYQLYSDPDAQHWTWGVLFCPEVKADLQEQYGDNLKLIINETLSSL